MLLDDLPLSKTAALALAEYDTRPATKAIALSETGAWGMAWGRDSKQNAVADALAYCKERLNTGFPDGHTFGKCRLIWFD